MTGAVVNLRLARKQRARAKAAEAAAENRVRFGRSRGERDRLASESAQAERRLDGHYLGPSDDSVRD